MNVQRFAAEIHRNAKRLLTLINDIIRLSELDADDMEVAFADRWTCMSLAERLCTSHLASECRKPWHSYLSAAGIGRVSYMEIKKCWKSCCTI